MVNNSSLRLAMRQRRKSLSLHDIHEASLAACQHIAQHPNFKKANTVALYSPFEGEIDPLSLFSHDKCFCLPVVQDNFQMQFINIESLENLTLNRFGILEPSHGKLIDDLSIDIVVTPLVSFNQSGTRVGMGGGFYDRFFTRLNDNVWRVGLAYSWQECATIEAAPWDVPLHAIATEAGLVKTSA